MPSEGRQITVDEFKDRLIADGIESIKKNETRPERIKGGLAGFELCSNLNSMADFNETLESRHKHEFDWKRQYYERKHGEIADYWEYRYATVQVEYVFERMLVVWTQLGLYSGPISARAVLRTADILERA